VKTVSAFSEKDFERATQHRSNSVVTLANFFSSQIVSGSDATQVDSDAIVAERFDTRVSEWNSLQNDWGNWIKEGSS